MTWLAIRLFMGKALERLLSALRWLLAHPWQAALIASLCLSLWLWRADRRHIAERDDARATIADMTAKAKAARQATVTIAKDSDHAHETRLADNRDRTTVYIERNRVRPQACPAAAEGEDTGSPEATAPLPVMVAVSEPDVKTCGDLQAYAWSAYEWGQRLKDAGLAD